MSFEVGDRVQWRDDPELVGEVLKVEGNDHQILWDGLTRTWTMGHYLTLVSSPVKSTPEVDLDACLCPSLLLGHEDGCPHKGRYARTHVLR